MKLKNYFIFIIAATIVTCLYAHQRIEATILSYEIKEMEFKVNKLLDRREELEYNVARLKTPTYLELKLAKKDLKYVLPERWQVFETSGLKREVVRWVPPLFAQHIAGAIFRSRIAHATPVEN